MDNKVVVRVPTARRADDEISPLVRMLHRKSDGKPFYSVTLPQGCECVCRDGEVHDISFFSFTVDAERVYTAFGDTPDNVGTRPSTALVVLDESTRDGTPWFIKASRDMGDYNDGGVFERRLITVEVFPGDLAEALDAQRAAYLTHRQRSEGAVKHKEDPETGLSDAVAQSSHRLYDGN